jgi:leader peptidase (prepilin peptidase)/N-methyltransferase
MQGAILDLETWRSLPFHFWTLVFAILGAIVGSFLNVCIHRMPRDESLVRPPSRCPRCGSRLRWRENIPILSWLWLGGRCASCRTRISSRYVLVEALTACLFGLIWMLHGRSGVFVALAFCVFVAGLVVAAFIDLEHLIIPDEITLGGTAAGVVLSVIAPGIHAQEFVWPALKASLIGAGVGAGTILALVELGKLWLGRQRFELPANSPLIFTESDLHLTDRVLAYDEVFNRASDALVFHASRLELIDRCYRGVTVQLQLRAGRMQIGEELMDPTGVPWMRAETDQVTVPREAMGLGDVKFMAALGAFTGWEGVMFALMGSSLIGVGVTLTLATLRRREWSGRIPYGPYLAAAALIWVLGGRDWFLNWLFPATG